MGRGGAVRPFTHRARVSQATGSVLGAATLGVLLTASLPAVGTTISAPYRHSVATDVNQLLAGGCSYSKTPVPAAFHPSTGVGRLSTNGTVASCPWNQTANRTGSGIQWIGGWTVDLPIHFSGSGANSVNVTWAFDWSATDRYSVARPCHGIPAGFPVISYLDCEAFAGVSLSVLTWVVDESNGTTYLSGSNFAGFENSSHAAWVVRCAPTCVSSTYATPTSGNTSGSINATFLTQVPNANASDHWELVLYVYSQLLLDVHTSSSHFTQVVRMLGRASGAIRLSGGSNGSDLRSIQVS